MSASRTTDTTTSSLRLGDTDTYVAPLALGAMNMGTLTPEPEARRILDHFVSQEAPRFTAPSGAQALAMIDTADCYCWWNERGAKGGHSETLLRRWFDDQSTRDQVFLATKGTATIGNLDAVWGDGDEALWDEARVNFVGASAQALKDSLAGSLERLGTDRVDLYYIHVDDRSTPLEETLETLASFVADGRIGAYGWSNVRTWRLSRIRALCEANGWPQPLALQQQHSYLRRKAGLEHGSIVDDEQLDYLRAHGDLQLVAYSPLLKGAFTAGAKRADVYLMDAYRGPDADARFAAIDAMAKTLGCTPNQMVLAWMMAQDNPSVLPLIGPRTFEQYIELAEAVDVTLTHEQREELDQAGA